MERLRILVCASLLAGCLGMAVVSRTDLVECAKSRSLEDMKFVITSQKGEDGRWTEEVKMDHGGDDWHIEVDHQNLEGIEGRPRLQITAILSAKSKTTKVNTPLALAGEPAEKDDVGDTDIILEIFPKTHLDWFGAKKACEEWGGNLAIPNSKVKMEKMAAGLESYMEENGEITSAFLGFGDQWKEGFFESIFGEPVFSTNKSVWSPHWFRSNQPDDDKSWTKDGEDCGSLHPSGGLNDVPCRYNLPFICEKVNTDSDNDAGESESNNDLSHDGEEKNEERSDDEEEDESTLELFPSSPRDWHGAKRACIQWGGHLAIPNSEAKMLKMSKMLSSREKNPEQVCAFLGFDDMEEEGNFVTIFGKPVFSVNASWSPHWFRSDQPDDDKDWSVEGEDCGSIHPSGGLNDVPCRYNLPYFCEKTQTRANGEPNVEEVERPEIEEHLRKEDEEVSILNEKVDINNNKTAVLKFFKQDNRNWFEAKRSCEEWGGHLAIPDAMEKISLMTLEMSSSGSSAAFLGFGDQEEEGNFVTIFGAPVFNSTESEWSPRWWRDDQPDDDKSWSVEGEDCGSIRQDGGLNDVPCRYNLPFFCEKTSHGADDEPEEENDNEYPDIGNGLIDEDGDVSTDAIDVDLKQKKGVTLKFFKQEDLDWFEAKETCEKWGGHLAIPDAMEKVSVMTSEMSSSGSVAAFLGFGDQEEEGNFVTIFGDPVFNSTESEWSPRWWRDDQPDNDRSWFEEGEDCGSIRQDGGLNDVPCRYNLPFFCEKTSHGVDDEPEEENDNEYPDIGNDLFDEGGDVSTDAVDVDLKQNKGVTLKFFKQKDLDWFEAKETCEKWGGHLAIPDAMEKVSVMTSEMSSSGSVAAFLGFGDQDEEGNFVTIFGDPVFNSTESEWSPRWWRDDQPDNDRGWFEEGEDCGSIRQDGGLNDVPCRYNLPFFCEKNELHNTTDAGDKTDTDSQSGDGSSNTDPEIVPEDDTEPDTEKGSGEDIFHELNELFKDLE